VATHAQRYSSLDLPHPLRAAAPLIALGILALLFEIDPALPWLVGVGAAACFTTAGALRATRARLDLAAVRRTADRLIVHEPCSLEASELIRWRTEELTSRTSRDALRREIHRTLRDLDPRKLPSASPLRRPAARKNEPLLRQLADRIGSSAPVSARGILLTRSLLRDAGSPLYAEEADVLLPRAIRRCLGALEP
jgi:hypothetical protein